MPTHPDAHPRPRPSGLVPLAELRAGDRAMFRATNLDADQIGLLRDMGLSERHQLSVCKAGEPCIVQVQTTRLGISARLAARILVAPVDGKTGVP